VIRRIRAPISDKVGADAQVTTRDARQEITGLVITKAG
jgi:hypothetical protein